MAILHIRQDGVIGAATGVKNTFSSWDKCMEKTYCKWPVIVAIIVVSLIALSLLWCLARCLCCGAECACCCFRCCAGCCGSGKKDKGHQHLNSVPSTPYGHPPPMYNQQYHSAPAPVYSAPPQFATFESGRKVHEDSLPAMPSWQDATSKKVAVFEEGESHELDKLKPQEQGAASSPNLVSPTPSRSPGPRSPFQEQDSFLRNGAPRSYSPYGGPPAGPHADSHSGYRGATPNPVQQGYGNQQYGRKDPYIPPRSPGYAPSGSTAYEPPAEPYNAYQPSQSPRPYPNQPRPYNGISQPAYDQPPQSYGNQARPYNGQVRPYDSQGATQGSWRDI
ncbi:hypothetical protein EJ06DRAFT_546440 [Trichodelitschia bisporula]|uniref:Fibroin-3 related protein n=1 Tax=Trichodelitschia bisporula TaxID=703511 RepID=A0A6G1I8J9_9PEZI|nr:hypothetical protein EJ06DRAFT_546440 [Trichodelitschia bisporula]